MELLKATTANKRKIYLDLSEEIVALKRNILKAQILTPNKRQMAVPIIRSEAIENEEKAASFSFHIYLAN